MNAFLTQPLKKNLRKVIPKSITLVQFIDNQDLRTYPLDNIDHLDCSNLYHHNFDHNRNHNQSIRFLLPSTVTLQYYQPHYLH